MKKIIQISIATLFFVSNINLVINNHLCMGKIKKIEVASMVITKSCCAEDSHNKATNSISIEKKSCCENKTIVIQITDNYTQSNHTLKDKKNNNTILYINDIQDTKKYITKNIFFNKDREPPPKPFNRDLLSKKQLFIIWFYEYLPNKQVDERVVMQNFYFAQLFL